jgi:hypothetical protein
MKTPRVIVYGESRYQWGFMMFWTIWHFPTTLRRLGPRHNRFLEYDHAKKGISGMARRS